MNRDIDNIEPEGEHIQALLSAYIDSDLTLVAHERVRRHIETCADCRADYIELRATQQMLRSLPMVVPPRAFTLTEADVAQTASARAGLFQRLLSPRNSPRFAMGSGLAFTLLVFLLMGNLLTSKVSITSMSPAAYNFSASTEDSGPAAPAPSARQGQVPTYESGPADKSFGGAVPYPTTPPAAQPATGAAPPEATPPADIVSTDSAMAAPTQVAPDGLLGDAGNVEAGRTISPTTAWQNFSEIQAQESTTVTLQGDKFAFGLATGQTPAAGVEHLSRPSVASMPTRQEASISSELLFEASLAALGIILAVGAIVTRRRKT